MLSVILMSSSTHPFMLSTDTYRGSTLTLKSSAFTLWSRS
jgi:hypothetical protein